MHNNHTTQPPRPKCQVCGERDGQSYIESLFVCGVCYEEAKSDIIRLWRASLRLVQGGYTERVRL